MTPSARAWALSEKTYHFQTALRFSLSDSVGDFFDVVIKFFRHRVADRAHLFNNRIGFLPPVASDFLLGRSHDFAAWPRGS